MFQSPGSGVPQVSAARLTSALSSASGMPSAPRSARGSAPRSTLDVPPPGSSHGSQLGLETSCTEKKAWGSGPMWRTCQHGLCLEGECPNPLCVAHGKQVIFSAGFTSLDLVNDSSRCRCPMCYTILPQITGTAFNNCEWKLSGWKKASPTARPEHVNMSDWQVAGNCYERFKDDPNDTTIWTSLIITTRKLPVAKQPSAPVLAPPTSGGSTVECSICYAEPFNRFAATAINTPCGHCFHRDCLKPWLANGNTACPTCRADVSCLAPMLFRR